MPDVTLVHVTAYCLVGVTASGVHAGTGVAACGLLDPFGTQYCLPLSNLCWTCQDRGRLIVDGELDIWTLRCDGAVLWGHRYLWLERRLP